jgi:hypothetical protein
LLQGKEATFDANPATIHREGKKQPYFSQFIPRASKELQENLPDYQRFIAVFEEVFEWQRSIVSIFQCWPMASFYLYISDAKCSSNQL